MHSSDRTGQRLLSLVDPAKPFKGAWRIDQESESRFVACHAASPHAPNAQLSACHVLTSSRQVCQFIERLQFYGWMIEGQTPEIMRFRQACAL